VPYVNYRGGSRVNGYLIAGHDLGDGRSAAWLLGLRADDGLMQTKPQKFLTEMEVVVPWQTLIDLIEPHHLKASKKGGRPPPSAGNHAAGPSLAAARLR
jgi:hypothetical protein